MWSVIGVLGIVMSKHTSRQRNLLMHDTRRERADNIYYRNINQRTAYKNCATHRHLTRKFNASFVDDDANWCASGLFHQSIIFDAKSWHSSRYLILFLPQCGSGASERWLQEYHFYWASINGIIVIVMPTIKNGLWRALIWHMYSTAEWHAGKPPYIRRGWAMIMLEMNILRRFQVCRGKERWEIN